MCCWKLGERHREKCPKQQLGGTCGQMFTPKSDCTHEGVVDSEIDSGKRPRLRFNQKTNDSIQKDCI